MFDYNRDGKKDHKDQIAEMMIIHIENGRTKNPMRPKTPDLKSINWGGLIFSIIIMAILYYFLK